MSETYWVMLKVVTSTEWPHPRDWPWAEDLDLAAGESVSVLASGPDCRWCAADGGVRCRLCGRCVACCADRECRGGSL